MAKGPTYNNEEQDLLEKLAKRGGSPTVLAKEFLSTLPGNDRSETALVQKIRKMIIDLKPAGSVPAKRTRAPRAPQVNAAPMSDAPAASPQVAAADGSTRVRKPASFIPTVNGNLPAPVTAHNGNGNGNGSNGHDVITVDLGGLKLIGSKKRVGEALQQLG